MEELIKLLKEQNKLMIDHNALFESSLGEFKRLLQLQAAEAKVNNARGALIDETLQKLLNSVSELGENSKKLLDELSR